MTCAPGEWVACEGKRPDLPENAVVERDYGDRQIIGRDLTFVDWSAVSRFRILEN